MLRAMSLRNRLVLVILILVLLVVLAMAIFFQYSYKDGLREIISQQQDSQVATIAEELDRKIEQAHRMLINAAIHVTPEMVADADQAQAMLDIRKALHEVFDNHLFLFTPDGHVIAESPYLPGRRGLDLSYRQYIKDTVASGRPVISDPYISTQPHRHPVLMFTVPVLDGEGRLMAILTGSLDLMRDNWLGWLAQRQIGRKGYFYLSTMDRMLIMHPDRNRVFERVEPGVNVLFDQAMAGFEGTDEVVNSYGTPMLTTYRQLASRNWVLAANFPLHEAYAPLHAMNRILALATLGVLLLLVLVVSLTVRRLTDPLQRLTEHVAHLGDKTGPERLLVPRRDDEIGRLTLAFNAMVTELDQRLARAENERARSESVIAAIGDGLLIVDMEHRIIGQNEQHRRWVGNRLNGFCYATCSGGPDPCPGCPFVAVLHDGGIHRHQTVLHALDGDLEVEVLASPLRDGQGKMVAVILLQRDITERMRMEQELFQTRQLESLGVLAGGIAHDFNNLLAAILGNVSLAQMIAGPKHEAYPRLQEAEKACIRSRDLVQQLLTFSRGGAPVRACVSVEDLVRESAGFALRGSSVRGECSFADALWPLHCDAGQISQVVHNLVLNARQAMLLGGTVHIRAGNRLVEDGEGIPLAPGRYIEVEVADEGCGIAPEHLGRIFYPYFTTKETGSGLGLSTAYSIVKRHGGHIAVSSQQGEGAVFRLYLPACGEDVVPLPSGDAQGVRHGQGRVLAMDDEEQIRTLLCTMLRRLGYDPAAAVDGAEALALYRGAMEEGKPFAAVIMDLTIPGGMGGREALDALRRIDPTVRAIVSSGYANDPVMASHREHGFCACVAKPFTLEVLSLALADALESPR